MFYFFFYYYIFLLFSFFFFFQAEDGIRDLYVTGVQTYALPIFGPSLERDGLRFASRVLTGPAELAALRGRGRGGDPVERGRALAGQRGFHVHGDGPHLDRSVPGDARRHHALPARERSLPRQGRRRDPGFGHAGRGSAPMEQRGSRPGHPGRGQARRVAFLPGHRHGPDRRRGGHPTREEHREREG